MGDAGYGAVVVGGIQPQRSGPALEDEGLDQSDGERGRTRVRRHGPGPAVEERGAGGQRARSLAAGHRVRPDVAGQVGGGHRVGHRGQRGRLHAPDVRDDRVRTLQRVHHSTGDRRRRDRHHDQLGSVRRPRRRPAPRPVAVRTFFAEVSRRTTSSPRRRQTSATDVPMSPAPTTSTGPVRAGRSSVMAGGPGEVATQVGRTVQVDVGDVGSRQVGLDVRHQPHDPRHRALDLELARAHQRDVGEAEWRAA